MSKGAPGSTFIHPVQNKLFFAYRDGSINVACSLRFIRDFGRGHVETRKRYNDMIRTGPPDVDRRKANATTHGAHGYLDLTDHGSAVTVS